MGEDGGETARRARLGAGHGHTALLLPLGQGTSYLRGVGGSSATLAAGGRLAWAFGVLSGEPMLFSVTHSESSATALALAFSFSRSVWLTGAGAPRPAPILDGSLSRDTEMLPCLVLSRLGSMLLLTGRVAPRPPVTLMELDLAGRGRLRYWMLERAPGARNPGSAALETSRLVFLPLTGLTGMPELFWILPSVAEPPACMTVAVPVAGAGFL